jgi:hypothetical protein
MLNDGEKKFQSSNSDWNFFPRRYRRHHRFHTTRPAIIVDAAKLNLMAFRCEHKISPRSTVEKCLFNSASPAARVFPSRVRAVIDFTSRRGDWSLHAKPELHSIIAAWLERAWRGAKPCGKPHSYGRCRFVQPASRSVRRHARPPARPLNRQPQQPLPLSVYKSAFCYAATG